MGIPISATVGLSGCSGEGGKPYAGEVYPVSGQVLLPNGKPLTEGRVIFIPTGSTSPGSGELGSDGTFAIKTPDGKEGAGPGEYKVRIEPKYETTAKGQQKPLPFPLTYTEIDGDTGWTATVKAEPTHLPAFRMSAAARTGRGAVRH